MRKTIIAAVFIAAGFVAGAQTPDDAVKELEKNRAKAKETIDKITADPANAKNADAWYAKAQIYNILATDEKFRDPVSIGMTKSQVISALGTPANTSQTTTAKGKTELLI